MSLQVGLLKTTSRWDAIKNTIISLLLALLALVIFLFCLKLGGFDIPLDGLYEFSVLRFFERPTNFATIIYWAVPLTLTALAVAIAFQAGLFNIGGQGQMSMGSVFTAGWAAVIMPNLFSDPNSIMLKAWFMIPSTLFVGFTAGAVWGFIPGYLKAKTGAHEVITTIMMNQIAAGFVIYLVGAQEYSPFYCTDKNPFYPQCYSSTDPIVPGARFNLVFESTNRLMNWGFVVAFIIIFLTQILIYRSKLGFKLRAVGLNQSAAEASGIKTDRMTMLAMTLSGGVAGIAGALLVMGKPPYYYLGNSGGTLGFDGIAVALISQNNPLGIGIAAIFFGYLTVSRGLLDNFTDIPPELILAFQGWIILFAAAPALSKYLRSINAYEVMKKAPRKIWNFILDSPALAYRYLKQGYDSVAGLVIGISSIFMLLVAGTVNYFKRMIEKISNFLQKFTNKKEKPDAIEPSDNTKNIEEEGTDQVKISQTNNIVGRVEEIGRRVVKNRTIRLLFKAYIGIEIFILILYVLNQLFLSRAGYGIYNPLAFNREIWSLMLETFTFKEMLLAAVPIMFTAIGAAFNERSGVINIGVEGIMVFGAWTAVYVTLQTGNPWVGMLWAGIIGGFVGLIHAIMTITFKAEQIVTGVAINVLAVGTAQLLSQLVWGAPGSDGVGEGIPRAELYDIPVIGFILKIFSLKTYYNVPIIGKWFMKLPDIVAAFNGLHWMIVIAVFVPIICHWLLFKTTLGLRIRVIGEEPEAAATAGINVHKYQYFAVIFSGMLAGLGGGVLSIGNGDRFTPTTVSGTGFIALAAMIFGKWTVIGATFASVLFGYVISFQSNLDFSYQVFIFPPPLITTFPYIIAILALAGFIGSAIPPKNIGKPYDPTD